MVSIRGKSSCVREGMRGSGGWMLNCECAVIWILMRRTLWQRSLCQCHWLTDSQDGYSTGLWLRMTVSVVVGGCVGVLANSTIKRLTAPISCSVVLHTPHPPHHQHLSNVIRCTSSWHFRSPRATSHTSPQLNYRCIYLSRSCSYLLLGIIVYFWVLKGLWRNGIWCE